ncbi:MAG: ATP-binding cassette domain-containing protein [Gemmatimonadaceae bacterium]|nr:ATP-binding cassette domain-containing protein [Gemmatimonadaceae bacterium]
MSVALSAARVTHSYGTARALDDVSVSVPAGGSVALVGESGSGKTTLLRCFNRMVEPHGGEILVDGVNVSEQDPIVLRRRLGYVQQQGGLLPHWTVSQNVGLVLRAMGRTDARAVDDAIALVGLDPSVHGPRFPRELSGGQRQRVALARALAAGPQAILLDEPFGALDAITRGDVQSAFERVQRELGLTMLFVTHDLAEAARLATRIVVMRAGRVEQEGSMTELRDSPATAYVQTLLASAATLLEALRTA